MSAGTKKKADDKSAYVDIEVEGVPEDMPPSSARGGSSTTHRAIVVNDPVATAEANPGAHKSMRRNDISSTKYHWYTFPLQTLYEQFRRVANTYFLFVAILQLVPGLTNVSAWSSILPLGFVLGVTALKEGYEDVRRAQSDSEINNRVTKRVKEDGSLEEIAWKNVQVGMVIKLVSDDEIPADIALLGTSLPSGIAYLETANLDGETNLKVHQAPKELASTVTSAEAAGRCSVSLKTELPNNRLYVFEGTVDLGNGQKVSLSNKNILLRGCKLRNTKFVYGVVVFSGSDTKLVQNSTAPPSKMSTMEQKMNKALIQIFAFMFSVCAICGLLSQIKVGHEHYYIHGLDSEDEGDVPDYAASYFQGDFSGFLFNTGSYIVLFSVMIPISLYVSVEMTKLVQAKLIELDVSMYYEPLDLPARAKTTNLTEELGQVQYVFSDKTGTLTCNIMEFNKFCVNGKSFNVRNREAQGIDLGMKDVESALTAFRKKGAKGSALGAALDSFWLLLAVCHTVLPDEDSVDETTKLPTKWQAESPDELALVEAAADAGYVFVSRKMDVIRVYVKERDETLEYRALNFNEFNSTRKRMSMVVEEPDGTLKLMIKGADSMIAERLRRDEVASFEGKVAPLLDSYALVGLRTLLCAERVLSLKDYEAWNRKAHAASTAMNDRSKKMAEAAEEIEVKLSVVGATAIEDKLQDGVPETIANLIRARIKVWVLTGDKVETAVNIALSCNLLRRDMNVVRCVKAESIQHADRMLSDILKKLLAERTGNSEPLQDTGLVVDGHTLEYILDDEVLRLKVVAIGQECASVVCCRVSPLQKSLVVKLVRDVVGARTLAIGDGANDVSMIQAAHVGIGISGREGMQAVMASDYAIGQFRFLQTLLLVHGRYNYKRISKLVVYSFYKNMAFIFSQVWFTIVNLFSAANMYTAMHLSVYNVFFTFLPIMSFAILEQDVPRRMVEQLPELYETGLHDHEFSSLAMWRWLLSGMYTATVIYFGTLFAFDDSVLSADGRTSGLWSFGSITMYASIVTVNVRLMMEMHYMNWVHIVSLILSVFSLFLFSWLLEAPWSILVTNDYIGVFTYTMEIAPFWGCILLLTTLSLLPDLAYKYLARVYMPQNYEIVQEIAAHTTELPADEIERIRTQYGDQRPPLLRITDLVNTIGERLPGVGKTEKQEMESGFAFSSRGGGVDVLRALGHYAPKADRSDLKMSRKAIHSGST